jgi:hypothetical protein
MRPFLQSTLLFPLLALPALAADPPATTIVEKMRAALEPARPSIRRLTLSVSAPRGDATQLYAGQARTRRADGDWMLTIVLQPSSVRGIAFLVRQARDRSDDQWTYLPAVRRVRKVVPVQRYQAFLGSDFTFADLGFVSRSSSYELLATEQRDGVRAHKVQEVPGEQWYYARVVTWIDADSALPLRREFYDPSNTLWKVERFAEVKSVDGVPTPMRIRMEDVREPGHSEIVVTALDYDASVPDELFDPEALPGAADSPVWSGP